MGSPGLALPGAVTLQARFLQGSLEAMPGGMRVRGLLWQQGVPFSMLQESPFLLLSCPLRTGQLLGWPKGCCMDYFEVTSTDERHLVLSCWPAVVPALWPPIDSNSRRCPWLALSLMLSRALEGSLLDIAGLPHFRSVRRWDVSISLTPTLTPTLTCQSP